MIFFTEGRVPEKTAVLLDFVQIRGGGGLKTLFQISVVITCSGNVTKH